MLTFALEGATYRSERPSKRKDIGCDEQIGICGSYRMPVDAVRGYRDLGHQVGACNRDALRRETPQRDSTDHPVRLVDPLRIKKATKLLGLMFSGHRCC